MGTNGDGSWYGVTQALEKLGISRRTLYDKIKKQHLTTKKVGKNRFVWLDGTEGETFTSQHNIRTNQHNAQVEEQLLYFKNKVIQLENELKEQRQDSIEERKRHDTIMARMVEQNQLLLQGGKRSFWKFW